MKRFEVWYAKSPTFKTNNKLTINNLKESHIFLREIEATNLEHVYTLQQGEIWSPNGGAFELIKSKGLHHISMSVGDVVHDLENNEYYQVISIGWRRLS